MSGERSTDDHHENKHTNNNRRSLEDEEKATPDSTVLHGTQPVSNHDDKNYLVAFAPSDPDNPHNWSTPYRAWLTLELGLLALAASAASAIIAPANPTIARHFHVGQEVVVLNVSLFVIGFAVGPLLWAPISEVWGRRVSLLPPMCCLTFFSIGAAVSPNAQTLFIMRFFSGVFGSAPVSNVSAALGDIWSREHRGIAVSFYAAAVVGGPTLAPVAGAAVLVNPNLGWRWTEYITAIYVFATVIMAYFFLPEVYGPVLLRWKAQRRRKETGDDRWWHPHEKIKLDFKSIVTKQLSRPLKMLLFEPMVMAICFYASFAFAILYLTLEVFPIVFEEDRGWSTLIASLPFLGLFVGVLCALVINIGNQPRYTRLSRAAGGRPVPEARCPPMAVGGIIFFIGLFWFGWTASPQHHWVLPVIATAFIGAGFNSIFQQCINFLVDTYGIYAASSTAANTFLRSIFASGLPLAARPMINAMGIGPAMSVLGAVAVLAVPVPFLFMKYGLVLRKMSKFAPVSDEK